MIRFIDFNYLLVPPDVKSYEALREIITELKEWVKTNNIAVVLEHPNTQIPRKDY